MFNETLDQCSLFGHTIEKPHDSKSLDKLESSFVIAIATIQIAISLSGIIGNTLSLIVLSTNKSLQTIPNLYIGALSVVDLIVCLLIPVSTGQLLATPIDHLICKIVGYTIIMSMSASFSCMMLIAINRYVLIIKGRGVYNKLYSMRNSIGSIILVWLWLLIINVIIPETSGFGIYGFNDKTGSCIVIAYCFKNYIYVCILLTLTIFMPVMTVTGWAYFRIVRRLIEIRKRIDCQTKMRPQSTVVETDINGNSEPQVTRAGKEEAIPREMESDLQEQRYHSIDPRDLSNHISTYAQNIKDDKRPIIQRKPSETELISHSVSYSSADVAEKPVEVYSLPSKKVKRSKSALRRLSPSNIRIHSTRMITKLRLPQWRKHCLAIFNMITINVVSWVCWAPLVLQYVIDINGHQPAFTYKIEVTIVFLNSAFNVLLYAMMNNAHREAYKSLLCKCFRKS